ncbi:MAG: hypothetical protein ACREGL_11230 [Alphaproteobacteria bacterium]
MFKIDPARLDLAREFKAKPYGPHSPDLQYVLHVMRAVPIVGKHVLVMTKSNAEWMLAEMTPSKDGAPPRPRVVSNRVYASTEEAEWDVFKLRWKMLTGRDLELD